MHTLRDAGFDNISLDLIYGIPGQSAADLERDLAEALALEPEHLSCYELEAKPGTRFTHAHGAELERQAEALEGYFENVVDTLTGAGYRWYETANFCRPAAAAEGRDLRAQHNLGYWRARDYLGIGIGRGLDGRRHALAEHAGRRALPRRTRRRALGRSARSRSSIAGRGRPSACSWACASTSRSRWRDWTAPLDPDGLARVERLGLAVRRHDGGAETVALTPRGRLLGGGVTAELVA